MFDIGWTEMLVIAIVMIVVVGPKDLPKMLRTFGKTTAKMRVMASDFQRQFNEALREAELEDVKKSVDELRSLNPANEIKKHLNPFEKAAADVRAGLDTLKAPAAQSATPAVSAADPASPVVHAAEPLKNGATAVPGVSGPETMPPAPVMTPLNGAAPDPAAATAPAVTTAAPASSVSEVASPAQPAKPDKPAAKKAASPKAPRAKAAAKSGKAAVGAVNGNGALPSGPAASEPKAAVAAKTKPPAVKSVAARASKAIKKTKANAS
jgi:sec-independent protein translocase protein TatB